MKANLSSCALCALWSAGIGYSSSNLQDVLSRMDQAAARFQAMTAKVQYTTHTAVIDDTTVENGTVVMKKVRADEVTGRIDFLPPNERMVLFEQRKAEIYYPKIKTLQIYDLGAHGEQLDRFILLGFGTSGTELARDYDVKVLGAETIAGIPTTELELLPKSPDIQKVVVKLDIWVQDSPNPPYPVQEKIYEKSAGDYRLINYSDVKLNPPISDAALKLKLPSGFKTEYPQK